MAAIVERYGYPALFAALLAGVTAFRVLALYFNATELFYDEAQYWSWSLEPAAGYYSKPPLIALVIAGATTICGDSEFCVRLPSPLLHAATSILVAAIGCRLYGARIGFWSGLVYLTLPGVSFSSNIISTDVPLLTCWALALYGFAGFIEKQDWRHAFLIAFAFGVGLNAKYAMLFFAVCAAIYLLVSERDRRLLRSGKLWLAFAIGTLFLLPNLLWNLDNDFSTLAHTADNAKLQASRASVLEMLGVVAGQFGILGPVLFTAYIVIALAALRGIYGEREKLLLAFSLPIFGFLAFMNFALRANANWAAPAFVAAAVLVTAVFINGGHWRAMRWSMWLHGAVIVLLAGAFWQAGKISLPGKAEPFRRVLGWRAVADAADRELREKAREGKPYKNVFTLRRSATAQMLYYLRHSKRPVLAWHPGGRPRDHYQLTRPYRKSSGGPTLLVTFLTPPAGLLAQFATARMIKLVTIARGNASPRTLRLYHLDGYRGP